MATTPPVPDSTPAPAAAAAGLPQDTPREMRKSYHEIWTAAALAVIHKLSNDAAWTAVTEAAAAAPQPTDLAAHWELAGGLNGKLSLKFHRTAARAWARLLQAGFAEEKPPSPTSPLTDQEKEALEQVLHQLARELAAAFQSGGWGEIQVQERHFGPLRRAVEGADGEFPLRFSKPETEPLELDLVMEPALRDQARRGPVSPAEAGDAGSARGANKLDLLLDVELDVTLRFGGRQMLLHDVLELAPSSVLELDRHIDDPVELLVGGKVIAWGEVVVVDGNYGLRITRLVHRKERMAAMGESAKVN